MSSANLDFDATMTPQDLDALKNLAQQVANEGMVIVEIGTWKGLSTTVLAHVAREYNGKVYCIDRYEAYDWDRPSPFKPDILATFYQNMSELGLWSYICPMLMLSIDAAAIFETERANLVFIDASHNYDSVKMDIIVWLPKVKPGGIICGHDWDVHEGVNKAVKELLPNYQVAARNWWVKC